MPVEADTSTDSLRLLSLRLIELPGIGGLGRAEVQPTGFAAGRGSAPTYFGLQQRRCNQSGQTEWRRKPPGGWRERSWWRRLSVESEEPALSVCEGHRLQ